MGAPKTGDEYTLLHSDISTSMALSTGVFGGLFIAFYTMIEDGKSTE